LNPAGDPKVERFGWTYAAGDKVMQIENDYDKNVYNGDIGYIDYIEGIDPADGELTASFDGIAPPVLSRCTSLLKKVVCTLGNSFDHSRTTSIPV
jgi:ATP-dependent exoDNAse (exonuclease V) alpha subunit